MISFWPKKTDIYDFLISLINASIKIGFYQHAIHASSFHYPPTPENSPTTIEIGQITHSPTY